MKLNKPFLISARLLPALQVGDAFISIKYDGQTNDGRQRYRYYIDLPDGTEYTGNDLASGVGGGSLQAGMESLLAFLGAAGESYPDDESTDMFPLSIAEWAHQNNDELGLLECELEESGQLIEE